jgi:hypothetical protein
MEKILLAHYMVFHNLVRDEPFDLSSCQLGQGPTTLRISVLAQVATMWFLTTKLASGSIAVGAWLGFPSTERG